MAFHAWGGGGSGGSVTSVSVVTANGVSGSVANPTTTPAITLTLGAITPSSVVSTGSIRSNTSLILEETGAGTDTITIQAPASIAASYTLTLPVNDGDSGQVMTTNGAGVMSWSTPGLTSFETVLIYNDTIPATIGNIYKTWAELQVAAAEIVAAGGTFSIWLEASLTVPTGSWYFGQGVGSYTGQAAFGITLQEGAVCGDAESYIPLTFNGCAVIFETTATRFMAVPAMTLEFNGSFVQNDGTFAPFGITTGQAITIRLNEGSVLSNIGGGPLFETEAAVSGNIDVFLDDAGSTISEDIFVGDGGIEIVQMTPANNGGTEFLSSQSGWIGDIQYGGYGDLGRAYSWGRDTFIFDPNTAGYYTGIYENFPAMMADVRDAVDGGNNQHRKVNVILWDSVTTLPVGDWDWSDCRVMGRFINGSTSSPQVITVADGFHLSGDAGGVPDEIIGLTLNFAATTTPVTSGFNAAQTLVLRDAYLSCTGDQPFASVSGGLIKIYGSQGDCIFIKDGGTEVFNVDGGDLVIELYESSSIANDVISGTGTLAIEVHDPSSLYNAGAFSQANWAGTSTSTTVARASNMLGAEPKYDATVGNTAQCEYATVGDAVDANKARILVISSTTEAGNIDINEAITPEVLIHIVPDVTIGMGVYRFTGQIDAIYVRGEGTISYAHTSANEELFDFSSGSEVDLDGIRINNASTEAGCSITPANHWQRFRNLIITLPNEDRAGVYATAQGVNYFSNLIFNGGGNACTRAFDVASVDSPVSGLIFDCDFKASSASATDAGVILDRVAASNIVFRNSPDVARMTIGSFTVVTGVNALSSAGVDVYLGTSSSLNDCYNDDGTLVLDSSGKVNNSTFLTFTESGGGHSITTSRFINLVTLTQDFIGCSNVQFDAGVVVNNGADDNGFNNCVFGNTTTGGAETITINATANRTRIIGCTSDAAIVDNGAGTVTAANTVH